MKKFSKLVAVVLAIAVIICPMMSVVSHATTTGGYKIEAIDANNLKLTINSTDGFIAYHATVGFNSNTAFQRNYTDANTGYTNGLKVISYTLKTAEENTHNKPAISAEASGNSLSVIVMPSDINNLDLCTEIVIGIRVADGTTASLTKIQAADDGADVTADPTLLSFPAAGSDGVIDSTAQDYIASNATTNAHTHSFTQQTQTAAYLKTAATCTADATYWYSCATCGLASSTEYFTATGTKIAHTADHTKTFAKDPASCTTDATYYDECSVCHQQLDTFWTENNTALGHNMTHHDSVSSTCKVQGNIEYYSCSRCGKFFAEESGATELTAEQIKRDLAAHTPSNTTKFLKSAATCGDDAIYYQECSVCGEQLNTTWTDLGSHNVVDHTFGEYVSDGNATCAVDGTKTRTCSVCKATETVTDTGSHLLVAHTVVNDAAVAATCTATGLTAGSHCSVCNEVIVAQTVVPALGHAYTYHANGDGTHAVGCERCDYSAQETCDTNGTDGICSKCGYKETVGPEEIDLSPTVGAGLGDSIFISYNVLASSLSGYSNFYLKVEKQIKDSDWNLVDAEPFYIYKSQLGDDYLKSSGTGSKQRYYFYFRSIELYSLSVPVNATLYCEDASGNVVAYDEFPETIPALKLKELHATAVKNSRLAMATAITDVLVAGDEGVKYFTRNNPTSDYALLDSPIADYDTSDASTSTNPYNTVNTPYSGTETATISAGLSASPYISFRLSNLSGEVSQYKVRFSYYNSNTGTTVTSVTNSDDFSIATSKGITYYYSYCRNIAMYCADADVTIEVLKDNEVVGTAHYSLEQFYASKDSDSKMGAVITALARMGQSFKAYKAG